MTAQKNFLRQAASAGAGPVSIITMGIGFFSDFAKPYINLVPYFLAFSFCLSIIIFFFILKGKFSFNDERFFETPKGKIFGMSVISTGFWLILLPVFALTPQIGVAASVSPDIAQLQETIFGKLDRIEQKIDQGFEKVLTRIDEINTSNGGLLPNPKTSNEFYHNARIHEINGNLIEAKKAYEEYFKNKLEYIDPYLSYAQILKNLEGKNSARSIMGQLRETYSMSPGASIAYILMNEDRTERIELLENLSISYPNYIPVYYYIGREYSSKGNGDPTHEELRKEIEAFEKVKKNEEQNGFSKFFIDKKMAEESMSFIKEELEKNKNLMLEKPISFKIEMVDRSISISFMPTELVQKIFYRLDKKGEFKDTGSMGMSLPGKSYTLPNYQVMESITLGEHSIEMKYIDLKGQESKVFEDKFIIQPLTIQPNPYKMIDSKTGKDRYLIFWTVFDNSKNYTFYYSVDNTSLNQKVDNNLELEGLTKGKHTIYMQGRNGKEKTNMAEMEFEVL